MGFPTVRAEDQQGIPGRLVPEPNLLEALGSGRLAGGAGPGPKVPTVVIIYYVAIGIENIT